MILLRRYGSFKLLLLFGDLLSFLTGGVLSLLLLFLIIRDFSFKIEYIDKLIILGVAVLITIISFRYNNLYKYKVYFDTQKLVILLLKHFFWTFVIILVLDFLIKTKGALSRERTFILSFLFLSYLFLFTYRFILKKFYPSLVKFSFLKRRILAIGAGKVGNIFYKEIQNNKLPMFEFVGFLDEKYNKTERQQRLPVLGPVDALTETIKDLKIDEIFITINDIKHEVLLKLINKCRLTGCNVNILSTHFGIIEKKMDQSEFNNLEYVTIHTTVMSNYFGCIKRIFDLFFAILLILVLSPFFLIIAIIIKSTSSGPVFYAPYSIGKDGRMFKFYKFRSMINNSSEESHKKLVEKFMNGNIVGAKLREDPRVTPFGNFLRRYSLDEFAQLINVIKGNMSLVGPRPSTAYEYEMMEEWHKKRFHVYPGMTGLWQVAGRSEVSYLDMIMMDIYYVENGSLWLDLFILFKTIFVVIKAKGGH